MPQVVGHFVAFGDKVHKAVRGRGRRDIAQRTHTDRARRDLKVGAQRQDDAPSKAGLRKLLRHAGHAKADAGQRNEQIVRTQFDLWLDAHAMLLKKLLDIDAGACLALQQDQRECRDFFHGMYVVKIAVIIRRGDKELVCVEAVPDGIRVLVLRLAGKRDVDLTGVQIVEHHLARTVQDTDLDGGIVLVECLKARNQIGLCDRIACTDDQLTREQLARLRELFLAALDEAEAVRDIVQQHLPLARQHNAARASGKQPYLQLLFELLDGLADRGLGDIQILRRFLYSVCGASGDWTMADYRQTAIRAIREKVGSGRALLALSGGVDSSVAAALMAEAIGSQLTCVFVDHGLMRKNEGDEVEAAFGKWDIHFIRVNAEDRFLSKLAGVTDPETKRKIIGEEFIRVFEAEAKKIGAVDYLVQGTIYPDVIESGLGKSAVIKSHHNVGGLPDYVDFKEIIEPLRMLFKDEVRQLGRELDLPEYLVMRQPFPGPGLAIRVIGDITKEKLDTLRDADFIFRDEIAKAGLDRSLSQYFAVLTSMRSVGVMGDGRTYDYTLALRAVNTSDFMTADWSRIPYDVLDRISVRIVNEVRGINRICYDITSKPPATIEWE